MKTFKKILFILIIGLSIVSCENKIKEEIKSPNVSCKVPNTRHYEIDEEEPPIYNEEDMIILGEQRQNPYEIDNMRHAYGMICHLLPNFIVGTEEPEVNTIYFRVLPMSSSDLEILEADTTILYFDYPLDYDIIQWGSYYHDPSVSDPAYTWLYAVVSVDHPLPQISTLEILQECYLPNEPNEETDLANDSQLPYDTIPDWRNGYALLEYVAYRETGNDDMFEPEDAQIFEQILSESAGWIENQPATRSSRSFWSWLRGTIVGVHPEGSFKVRNTVTNTDEPIKNARVFVHNFIKFYSGKLDASGHYYSSVRFRTRAWYHIRFHNHHTGTRIYSGRQFLFGPYHRRLGWHSRNGYSCTLYFSDVAWRYATINNASEVYFNYCQEYNILFPYSLRVWALGISGNDWAGSTPLFYKRNIPIAQGLFFIAPITSIILSYIGEPDMLLFVNQYDYSDDTQAIYSTVFHEFGHASHYEKVGNTYWHEYVCYIIDNMGYGDGSEPLAGYCGIGEMWGNFIGGCLINKYLGHPYPYLYIDSNGSLDTCLYNGTYGDFEPTEDWYHPGILAKIHQDAGCSITEIYNALTLDVYSLEILKQSLENQGIDNDIIESAYVLYHNWEPQERKQ